MPEIKSDHDGGGTVYLPSAVEVAKNNKNKQLRREHKQLLIDVAELKKELYVTSNARKKVIRKAKGKY